ncbi:MAG: hypothetical protein L0Z50_08680 [Verrucomicrobiales bacterium]|nr:hypothetical protein [Verrucomicrobiales bacterium]
MEIHTFVADSAADAVAQIRQKLGPEAVVLNVQPVPSGGIARFWQRSRIEVLAHLPEKPTRPSVSDARINPRPEPVNADDCLGKSERTVGESSDLSLNTARSPLSQPARAAQWRIGTLLEESGLLPLYSGRVLQEMQSRFGENPPNSFAEEIDLARAVLRDVWRPRRDESENAVHVFVGAPGTGKTTCLCKWLARTVLTEGRGAEVWRLDGHVANTAESLSIYCEILGVPIKRYVPAEIGSSSNAIFVDLPGTNPMDSSALEGLQYFVGDVPRAEVHLVLNAAYDTRLLLAQARAFSALRITDLIFTHLDEEHRWGKAWNFVLGTNYSIRSLSAGQNIPGQFFDASADCILAKQFRRD